MEKLTALRNLMSTRGIDAYIISSEDAHATEYTTDYWKTRQWLSGFKGSRADVVVTQKAAGLWTDGRYFIQAAKELEGSGIELFKMSEPGVPTYQAFVRDNIPRTAIVGFDGRTMAASEFEMLKKALQEKNITYMYQEDLVGKIWSNRPMMPTTAAFEHAPQFAGKSAAEKLADVRKVMAKNKTTVYLVTALDNIAWLFNIRGNDIAHLPVSYAFALITDKTADLFIDPAKVEKIASKLTAQGVTLNEYNALPAALKHIDPLATVYYHPEKTNMILVDAIPKTCTIQKSARKDIIYLMKATKTETELTNIKNAYIKEGIALTKTLKWFSETIKRQPMHESDFEDKLIENRKLQPHYIGDSFSAICAFGANAASMHYRADGRGALIQPNGFFLVDTGAQFLDGTTDTTRTIPLGELTDEMRRDYTLVLKGNIALSMAVFPEGTVGTQLDMLARQPVLSHGMNYKSGTGHGIGYCLGVHEGPHRISVLLNPTELKPGMLVSNEPGVYKEGRYGIRIENILYVKPHIENDDGIFMKFGVLTYTPIDTTPIIVEMLTTQERAFLNAYHQRTYEVLAPHLDADEKIWLEKMTQAV